MDILMPQLGETVAEGLISSWHKSEGDHVEEHELLLDIETDKVATEINAPASGKLVKILVDEGETVDVGTVLAILQREGEVIELPDPSEAEPSEQEPVAAEINGAGRAEPERQSKDRQRLSPSVRRALREHGVDASSIRGTGRDGRITLQDVEKFHAATAGGNTLPFSILRSRIAEHMVRSKATSPHVFQAIEVDFSAIVATRERVRESWRSAHGYGLSYLPFVARALCRAIAEYPNINASVVDEGLQIHDSVNLAIAVDLHFEGLVAPVVKNAQDLSVAELAEAIHGLAEKARSNQLQPDDMTEGTYTISNSGSFGTLVTAPIINQPQVAILSLDGIQKRPVVIESNDGDAIAIRPVGVLAQCFDHRAFDGAYSAAFLKTLKQHLEESDWAADLGP